MFWRLALSTKHVLKFRKWNPALLAGKEEICCLTNHLCKPRRLAYQNIPSFKIHLEEKLLTGE